MKIVLKKQKPICYNGRKDGDSWKWLFWRKPAEIDLFLHFIYEYLGDLPNSFVGGL